MYIIAFILILGGLIELQIYIYRKYAFKNLEYTFTFSEDEVYEGEEIELIETVVNHKALPLPCLKSEITMSKWLDVAAAYSTTNDKYRSLPSLFVLRGHQKITRRWKVRALKRGVFHVKEVTLVAKDLLGLHLESQMIPIHTSLMVLPTPLEDYEDFITYEYREGEKVVKRFILEDPFYTLGVREYRDQDTLSSIHWGMTARHGQLMAYNHVPTSSSYKVLLLNMQSHDCQIGSVISEEKIEKAIKICSGVLEQAKRADVGIGFGANTRLDEEITEVMVRVGSGQWHIYELRQVLARLPLQSTEDIERYLENLRLDHETTEVILVTTFMNHQIADKLRLYKQKGILVKVIVLAHEEGLTSYEGIQCYYLGGNTP